MARGNGCLSRGSLLVKGVIVVDVGNGQLLEVPLAG